MVEKLYGIKYKEIEGEIVLEAIRDNISRTQNDKIIELYKEYFGRDYPSFKMNEEYLELEGDFKTLNGVIGEHLSSLEKQIHDRRVDQVSYEIDIIQRGLSNRIIYMLCKEE